MGWLPLLVLIVFGMVSIAFMMQMPKEKPRHNIKRVIRGNPEVEVVEPEPVEVVDVVDVVEPVVKSIPVVTEPDMHPGVSVYILTTGTRDISKLKKILPTAKIYMGNIGYDDSCKSILKEIGVTFKNRFWNQDYLIEAKLGHWCSNIRFAKDCVDICVLIEDDVMLNKSEVTSMYKYIEEGWDTPILHLGPSGDTINVWNGHFKERVFNAVRSGIDNPMDVFLNDKHMFTSRGSIGRLVDTSNSVSSSIIRTMNRKIKLKDINNEIKRIVVEPGTTVDTEKPPYSSLTEEYSMKVMVCVLSRRSASETRSVIRNTWASGHNNVFFAIGKCCKIPPEDRKEWSCTRSKKTSTNRQKEWDLHCANEEVNIEHESAKHSDIIRMTDIDVYRHLPQKVKFCYKWGLENTNAQWFVKTDDDSVVRVATLENYLDNTYDSNKYLVIGSIASGWGVPRSGKWAEPDYKPKKYPNFPLGSVGHVVSKKVASYIADNSDILYNYQGEDVSIGIWLDESSLKSKVIWITSKHMSNHGNCKDTGMWVIGHNIKPASMKKCFAHLDEGNSITSKRQKGDTALCNLFPKRWDKVKHKFMSLLEIFHTIARDINAHYSLIGGAAIGYLRHEQKGIPWDEDLDIYLQPEYEIQLKQQIDKIEKLCHAKGTHGFKIFRCDSPHAGSYPWRYPFLDVFTKTFCFPNICTNTELIFPPKEVMFENTKTYVPKDVYEFIEAVYGKSALTICKPSPYNHSKEHFFKGDKTEHPCKEVMEHCF